MLFSFECIKIKLKVDERINFCVKFYHQNYQEEKITIRLRFVSLCIIYNKHDESQILVLCSSIKSSFVHVRHNAKSETQTKPKKPACVPGEAPAASINTPPSKISERHTLTENPHESRRRVTLPTG